MPSVRVLYWRLRENKRDRTVHNALYETGIFASQLAIFGNNKKHVTGLPPSVLQVAGYLGFLVLYHVRPQIHLIQCRR
jgi:hypothetical protein